LPELYGSGRGYDVPERLLHKLGRFVELSDDDRQALLARADRVHSFGPREDLARPGEEPPFLHVVLEGWACRYKLLADGRRQIISIFVPGDMCDPMIFLIYKMSHSLGTLTPVTVARFTRDELETLTAERPNIARAFWYDMLVSAEIQREWTVSLGCRTATQRMAHLFCEMPARLKFVGLSNGTECELPLTQSDLADTLGLSTVHVNRTLQELRGTGFIELKGKRLTIHDERALQDLALFEPSYLHY
jgi:CRP-like cAMP-binding protein